MSSVDDRQNSTTTGLQIPGLVSQLSPVEQLPFPEYPSLPTPTPRDPFSDSSPRITGTLPEPKPILFPAVTQRLAEYSLLPGVTRPLPDIDTGSLPSVRIPTATLRQPILIRGTGKKSTGTLRPPQKRRNWVVHTSVIGLLILIGLGTLLAVVPVGGEAGHSISVFQSIFSLIKSNGSNANVIEQQQAATPIVFNISDGNENYTGGVTLSPNGGGPGRFAYGNCTYWANMRYHALSGYWVPWLGNAWQWSSGASAAGWIVSSTPHFPSIIVLQPGVEGAGWYGHVAVVEHINSDGSVQTSNYNWDGYWNSETFVTFRPGSGVTFVWHP